MAAKVTKQPTDRITVRLPKGQIQQINALVQAGVYRTTTDLVYNAVKDLLHQQGSQVVKTIEAEKGLLELQKKLAEIDTIRKKMGL